MSIQALLLYQIADRRGERRALCLIDFVRYGLDNNKSITTRKDMIPAVGRYQAHDYIISHETGLSRSFLPVAITLLATTLDVQGVVAIRTAPRRPIIPNVSINTSSMNTDMSVFPSHSPRADSDDDPSPLAEYLDGQSRDFCTT